MMEEIFAIVDPKVGKGTIDTSMRQVIAFGREWKDEGLAVIISPTCPDCSDHR
jgi:hypothetical protein